MFNRLVTLLTDHGVRPDDLVCRTTANGDSWGIYVGFDPDRPIVTGCTLFAFADLRARLAAARA